MSKTNYREFLVYIGTYTSGASQGIYVYRMNSNAENLKLVSVTRDVDNPSYLAIDHKNRYLFAVNELTEFQGEPGGAVSSFAIEQKTGNLDFINQQPSRGEAPCYIIVDQTDNYVLVANYMGGNVSVLPFDDSGRLGRATDVVQHEGSSVHPKRQQTAHAHSIVLSPDNRFAFVCDLGLDKIMVYRFNQQEGILHSHPTPWAKIKDGAGPRHFIFHPNGNYAYLINELNSTVIAFSYDKSEGRLKEAQTISSLPDDFDEKNLGADIHISPSGKFLFATNRGHDSIAAFLIDGNTGRLTYLYHEPTQGKIPRNFAIDPTGKFLLVANKESDNINVFKIDQDTGELTATSDTLKIPNPSCIKFIPFAAES